jgi:IgGFc binding protein/Putative Ig domain/PKD domain
MTRRHVLHWFRAPRKVRSAEAGRGEQARRLRCYRPWVELLEERNAPGSILVSISEILGAAAAADPFVSLPPALFSDTDAARPGGAVPPDVGSRAGTRVEAGPGSSPAGARGGESPPPAATTPSFVRAGAATADLDHFVAFVDAFPPAPRPGAFAGPLDHPAASPVPAAEADVGGLPSFAAGGSHGESAGAAASGSGRASELPPWFDPAPPAAAVAAPSVTAPRSVSVPAPASLPGPASSPLPNRLDPAPSFSPGQPAANPESAPPPTATPAPAAAPVLGDAPQAPPTPLPPPPPPVLEVAQAFAAAGPGQLYLQGRVETDRPVGAALVIDFYAGVPDGPGGSGQTHKPLGAVTVTKTAAGPVPFTAVLAADVPDGQEVTAAVRGEPGFATPIPVRGGPDSDLDGIPDGLEAVGARGDGNGDSVPDAAQAGVATVPAATTGRPVTLEAPGHALRDVRVSAAEPGGTPSGAFPLGFFDFSVTGVAPGGVATVRLLLPPDVAADRYFKWDAAAERLVPFAFDGHTGAVLNGHVVTLYLQDGGRGDDDGAADGVITDPGGPGSGVIIMTHANGLDQVTWRSFEHGGTAAGHGGVTDDGQSFTLREGNSFEVGLQRTFTIPANPQRLTFTYADLSFDRTSRDTIKDAFEVAFLDGQGRTLAYAFAPSRDTFFNSTEDQPAALGRWTTQQAQTVNLDITQLFPGTAGTLVFRLVNNDRDTATSVRILTESGNRPPAATVNGLSGNEGQLLTLTGSFTDPDPQDTHTATVFWGDGAQSQASVSEANGAGTFSATHVYADNGTYTVAVEVSDGTDLVRPTATAAVANVAPAVTAAAPPAPVQHTPWDVILATFTDPGFTNAAAGTQETFTATIAWGDGSPDSAGTVTVTQGSPGVLTQGSVAGRHTYAAAGDYTVRVTLTDDDGGAGQVTLVAHVQAHGPTKFFVADGPIHSTFRYDQAGNPIDSWSQPKPGNQNPRGLASNADGSKLWCLDANHEVYITGPTGANLGEWQPSGPSQAEDLTVWGNDQWIVDAGNRRVYYYAGGAGYTGPHGPTSSFALAAANQAPTGVVTDGQKLWVTDRPGGPARVFVYTLAGQPLGDWGLDAADDDPQGITLNPTDPRDLWVVDRADAVVYRYADATGWLAGSHTAADTFALAAANHEPYGIADPIGDIGDDGGPPPPPPPPPPPTGGGAPAHGYQGTDFWLAFPASLHEVVQDPADEQVQSHSLRLYLTGATPTTGMVTIPNTFAVAFAVTPGKTTTINVPLSAALGRSGDATFSGRALHVTAGADVAVYALDRTWHATDSTLALPTERLGTEYIVASYQPSDASRGGSQFAVLAVEDETHVTVTPTVARGGNPPGTPFTLTLRQGDVYQLAELAGPGDVTGTALQSDRPVAVFGANRSTTIPSAYVFAADNLFEQLPPVSAWGRRHLTLPFRQAFPPPDFDNHPSTLRILGSVDNTQVQVTSFPPSGVPWTQTRTVHRGQFIEFQTSTDPGGAFGGVYPLDIVSDQPVLVAHYSDSSSNALNLGDPFMVIVPPVSQYANSYALPVPAYDPNDPRYSQGQYYNSLNVIVASADAGSVRLNGQPLIGFAAIGTTGYVGVQVSVAAGTLQQLTSTTSRAFGVISHGSTGWDSYGHAGGTLAASVGPAIAIESPADGSTFPAGQTVLVTGRATTSTPSAPIVRVTVDDQAVEALDAAGHFFTRLAVPAGRSAFRFQATDRLGRIATAFLTLHGQDAISPTEGLLDVAAFGAEYGRTSFDDGRGRLFADLTIRNTGTFALSTPLLLTVEHLSDPQVALAAYDGRLADGTPYYDLSGLVAGGWLVPGAATGVRALAFDDPGKRRFTYTLALRAGVNRAPAFVSVPNLEVVAGKTYASAAQATDPDNDPLTYRLVAGPAGLTINATTGQLAWGPSVAAVGRYAIVVRADDGRGGSALQRYELTVLPGTANRAPVFYSPPPVTATVGTAYTYRPDVRDPDGDAVGVTLSGPAGAGYAGGQVVWTPAPDQVGPYTLTLTASDGTATAQQTFTVTVAPAVGNHAPVITSTPLTAVRTGTPYQYQVRAQDEEGDVLAYAVSSATLTGLQVDASGLLTWPAPANPTSGSVTVTVSDGKGGTATQAYPLDVLAVTPATVSGTGFLDANGDGVPQAGEAGQAGWTVFLDRDGDGRRAPGEWSAVTDAAGAYSLPGVLPGSYPLRAERLADWGFTLPALGVRSITLSAGQALTGQHFGVQAQANRQPTLSGTPPGIATVGVPYTFPPTAADPDGDPLAFDLPVQPGGMFVHPVTGVVSWTPDAGQVGARPVLLRVQDGQGGVALLSFTVDVRPANHRPFLVSFPPQGPVELGMTYRYQLAALDPDPGDVLTYTKLSPPRPASRSARPPAWSPGTRRPAAPPPARTHSACRSPTPPASPPCRPTPWRSARPGTPTGRRSSCPRRGR